MEPGLIPLLGVGVPTLGAAAFTANSLLHEHRLSNLRYLAEQLQEEMKIAEDNAILRTEFEPWMNVEPLLHGGVPMVLAGNGGVSLGQLEAIEACRGSAHSSYGPILLAQPDNNSRRRFRTNTASLPGWTTVNVIEETFPRFPGFQDRTPSEAFAPDFAVYWVPDLIKTALDRWLPTIRLGEKPRYLKVKTSTGGSGVAPIPVIEAFKKEYPAIPVYVEMVLDAGDLRRKANVPELVDLYSSVADGICLYCNRRQPWLTDQAQAMLGPATGTSPWIDPMFPEDFNVAGDVHRQHKFSTIRATFKMVKVQYRVDPRKKRPPLFYTPTSQLELQAIQSIKDVLFDAALQSLPLQEGEPRFIYVILPVRPPYVAAIAHSVLNSVRPLLGFNSKLLFASVGKPLDRSTAEVPIAAVSLFPLDADLKAVKDYVTGKRPVDGRFQTPPSITEGR